MNASVILDYLISNSNENTLHFSFETCPLSLVKEAILRGFQVRHYGEHQILDETESQFLDTPRCGSGRGSGRGDGWMGCGYGADNYITFDGSGESAGDGNKGHHWDWVSGDFEEGVFGFENFNSESHFHYPYHRPNRFSNFAQYVDGDLPYYLGST